MAIDNTITVVGNITRDPELRFASSGMPITTFSIAWNHWKQDGEEDVSFFNVTCFRQLADNVASSLHKGLRVVVYGTLKQRSWTTEEEETRKVVEIIADDVAPSLRWATADVQKNQKNHNRSNNDTGGRSYSRNQSSQGNRPADSYRQPYSNRPYNAGNSSYNAGGSYNSSYSEQSHDMQTDTSASVDDEPF